MNIHDEIDLMEMQLMKKYQELRYLMKVNIKRIYGDNRSFAAKSGMSYSALLRHLNEPRKFTHETVLFFKEHGIWPK